MPWGINEIDTFISRKDNKAIANNNDISINFNL